MFQDSARQDRSETRAAKLADKAANASQIWAEVAARSRARDENTDRLKAARLARAAEITAEAATVVAPRKRKVTVKREAKADVGSKRAVSKR